ncbi:MAG: hypothetical protein LW854_19790 [Rubrivivax sp.]|jgi:hypothetical protein|nr:hypothetical protein [Rubrivivax sp.]
MKNSLSLLLFLCAVLACAAAQAGLKEDVAAKEVDVAGLRAEVDALTPRILVKDADARVFLSLSPLVSAISALNALPDPGRTILVRSVGANGRFWQDSETFCNSYAELNSADGLQAAALLSNFGATMRDDGAIDLATRVTVAGRVQVHVHFMGVRLQPRVLGQPIGGGICPPGGGVGTSIGVSFDKTKEMAMRLSFAPAPDGRSLAYTARITEPDKIDVTAQIHLGGVLPTIGHPLDFPIPSTPLASGSLPLLLGNEGVFKLPGGGSRVYSVVLTPKSFVANRTGITATWKSTIQFKTGP